MFAPLWTVTSGQLQNLCGLAMLARELLWLPTSSWQDFTYTFVLYSGKWWVMLATVLVHWFADRVPWFVKMLASVSRWKSPRLFSFLDSILFCLSSRLRFQVKHFYLQCLQKSGICFLCWRGSGENLYFLYIYFLPLLWLMKDDWCFHNCRKQNYRQLDL